MPEFEPVVWGVHAVQALADQVYLTKNLIGIGWHVVGDLRQLPPTREGFKARVSSLYPNKKPGYVINAASQLFRFVHEMKPSNYVVYRSKFDRQIHIGTIEGEYLYDPHLLPENPNLRPVKWLGAYPVTSFSQGALYELGSALTLFQIKNYAHEFRSVVAGEAIAPPAASDETVAHVAEEVEQSTRDFVLKQLAQQLKGHALQGFVADLLSTMGYRTIESPKGTDEGIDIIAHKDELQLEPPIIKVQVKSTEGTVGGPEVKALCGNLHHGEFALVVTLGTSSKQALDFAKSRNDLRLIDGAELVTLVLKHYGQLDPRYKALLPLKQVYIPEPVREETG